MSDTIITSGSEATSAPQSRSHVRSLSSLRIRKIREAILAYIFLLPAFLIIFVFGIYPLAFSVYQSSQKGLNKIVGTYDGVGNYVKALGNLAYVLGFWIAIFFLVYGIYMLWKSQKQVKEYGDKPYLLALPAALLAIGFALFVRFFFTLLPLVLLLSDDIRKAKQAGAEETTAQLFRSAVRELVITSEVQRPFWMAIGALLVAAIVTYGVFRILPHTTRNSGYFATYFQVGLLLISAAVLGWFIWQNIQLAYTEAFEAEESISIWSHMITISAGLVLLALSWLVWRSASNRDSNWSTMLRLAAGAILLIGAWFLIAELPQAGAAGDKDWYQGLLNTVYYAVGSIPFQFAISLMLATFIFQGIRGQTAFRMAYFLPYITPVVGAAAIFRILFSGRVDAPINSIITSLGMQPLAWLNESTGIFQLIIGDAAELPVWASGPSLSLVVIIIFGIWTFVGFNTVIFLAGLGGIPGELYEAASIDGAGRWAQFRNVTLPLLSPTIYFLTLYAVIGTFKSFTHIYVLRTPAALGSADTASVVIFDAMKRDTRYGYAAALAVLLLIIVMVLTVVNNRIASKRVFYG